MKFLACILLIGLVLAGCTSEAPAENDEGVVPEEEITDEPVVAEEPEEILKEEVQEPELPQAEESPATQNECSTLAPDCYSCVAKKGCGWCKTSNSCFSGTSAGPAVSSCEPADWAYDEIACQGPKGGKTCEAQYNCADCLTGAGCKWCIQGSLCASADSEMECFGGWLTESFRCNYASR
ncbi:hypothetical protein JXA56_05040 [Candidatus Micrarchaeota archaeon]|nr:hypothetical protein [Candidatus Micrarchaeota archaeon]